MLRAAEGIPIKSRKGPVATLAEGDVGGRDLGRAVGLTLASGINAIAEGAANMGGPLLLVWLLSRPKNNTLVFGPQRLPDGILGR
jgi:hypothetical protein